ncbi:hypothetical protein BGW36DRAFT_364489 [Talaromyces proteolyticus]|uniref:Thioester reductase (TE) domain-containing protein n=1 Tax=Talaromyces proteolyticus TaxID=1131652 RepID=A0AAD4PW21_9EURO|nr:uncharacterized protein BGW36DRAFT_364489 [Talaromyces proteolyticus]KAH8690940.1 hypothetical protein BGW36DRAFT_364489 [Talaromyces proteolyticus]
MAEDCPRLDEVEWFRDQDVCYKLAVQLPTKRIYVLCRGSMQQAMTKWEASMPEYIDEIFDTGKVRCLFGDITWPDYGFTPSSVKKLQEVTVVIHAAASIAVFQSLASTIRDNYLPVRNLARMANSFAQLKVESILENHQSPYAKHFPIPYAQGKYLAERMLFDMNGQRFRTPYPFYGPEGTIPAHTFSQILLEDQEYRSMNRLSGFSESMILDELPVDLAANVCFLHLFRGTIGVVHAGVQLYVPRTIGEFFAKYRKYMARSLILKIIKARSLESGGLAKRAYQLFRNAQRDWEFDCARSQQLKNTTGPLGLQLPGHDYDQFFKARVIKLFRVAADQIDRGEAASGPIRGLT